MSVRQNAGKPSALLVHRVPGNRRASVAPIQTNWTAWLKQEEPKAPAPPNTASDTPEGLSRCSRLLIAGGAMSILLVGWRSCWRLRRPRPLRNHRPPGASSRPAAQARELTSPGVFHLRLERRRASSGPSAISIRPSFSTRPMPRPTPSSRTPGVASQYGLLPSSDAIPGRCCHAAERVLAPMTGCPAPTSPLGFIEFYWSRNFSAQASFSAAPWKSIRERPGPSLVRPDPDALWRYDEPIAQILRLSSWIRNRSRSWPTRP